jgi:hypothetical protein
MSAVAGRSVEYGKAHHAHKELETKVKVARSDLLQLERDLDLAHQRKVAAQRALLEEAQKI